MTGQDWVIVIPVLLLVTPLVLELMDRFNSRKASTVRVTSASDRMAAKTLRSGGYAAGSGR